MRITRHSVVCRLVLIIILMSCVSTVSADIIEPGKKLIPVQYKLTNIDDYPNYVFLLYIFAPMIGYSEIKSEKEIKGYKFSSASIYAIRASDYRKMEIGDSDENIKQFFENNPQLIQSNVRLTFLGKKVPDVDPLVAQIIILEIKELTQTGFSLRLSSIEYRYSDGTIEEVTYQTKDLTPNPIYPSNLPEPLSRKVVWAWYCIMPLVALCGVVILRKAGKQGGFSR